MKPNRPELERTPGFPLVADAGFEAAANGWLASGGMPDAFREGRPLFLVAAIDNLRSRPEPAGSE